jgi:hypothetical protein
MATARPDDHTKAKLLGPPDWPYTPIDPVFKAKWVAALRSGYYQQAKGTLKRVQLGPRPFETTGIPRVSYCCLGVGCNLVGYRHGWVETDRDELLLEHDGSDDNAKFYGWKDIGAGELRGFPFIAPNAAGHLGNLNDEGCTFLEIADWIERYL